MQMKSLGTCVYGSGSDMLKAAFIKHLCHGIVSFTVLLCFRVIWYFFQPQWIGAGTTVTISPCIPIILCALFAKTEQLSNCCSSKFLIWCVLLRKLKKKKRRQKDTKIHTYDTFLAHIITFRVQLLHFLQVFVCLFDLNIAINILWTCRCRTMRIWFKVISPLKTEVSKSIRFARGSGVKPIHDGTEAILANRNRVSRVGRGLGDSRLPTSHVLSSDWHSAGTFPLKCKTNSQLLN